MTPSSYTMIFFRKIAGNQQLWRTARDVANNKQPSNVVAKSLKQNSGFYEWGTVLTLYIYLFLCMRLSCLPHYLRWLINFWLDHCSISTHTHDASSHRHHVYSIFRSSYARMWKPLMNKSHHFYRWSRFLPEEIKPDSQYLIDYWPIIIP